ncbi:MAG TPA: ATP-binding protein [Chloroflexota bacterium]|nr:ATP-binding protein [Chloroflexota bacterium]
MPEPRILVVTEDARLAASLRRAARALAYPVEFGGLSRSPARPQADVVVLDARERGALDLYQASPMVAALPLIAIVPPGDDRLGQQALEIGARALLAPPIGREPLRLACLAALGGVSPGRRLAREIPWKASVHESSQEMWRCETVLQVVALIGQHVPRWLGFDRVSVWIVDEHNQSVGSWYCPPGGVPPIPRPMIYSMANDSPLWGLRLAREILREGREFSYAANLTDEIPPDLPGDTSDVAGQNLAVVLRLSGAVLGWISVDNKLSGRPITPAQAPALAAFAFEAAAALAKAQLDQAATRRAQEQAVLMAVSLAVAAQRDPKAVCGVIVEQLARRFGYELISVYLHEEGVLSLQVQHGYHRYYETISDRGVIARAIRLGTPQFVSDTRKDPEYVPANDDVMSEICVPILIGDRAEGVINLESCRPGILDSQTQDLLILLAQQIAITVERTRVLEAEQRRANLAEALARATAALSFSLDATDIYQQMLDLLGTVVRFDTSNLYRFEQGMAVPFAGHDAREDPFSRIGYRFPVAIDPIFGPWIRGEQVGPELISDTHADPRWNLLGSGDMSYMAAIHTYMAIPLLVEGEIVGALTLGCLAAHAFDAITVGAVLEFGERLTRALRNARIYELERAANLRLQSVMRLQDEFVATVSHELRTPLTSILGFSENLLDHWERFDDDHRRVNVEKIQRSGQRLHRLVRDLLQISRLEAGSLRVNPHSLHVLPIIRQAVEELALKFSGQAVQVEAEVHRATLWADADRLRQIITNLLDNAAKYSPPGSPIAVSWTASPPWGTLRVHDQGSGIRPEDTPRLFRRFSKLDTAAREGHVGTGLGLYICKQLTESMGGEIWYEYSDLPRAGGRSAFCLRLPLDETDGHQIHPPVAEAS